MFEIDFPSTKVKKAEDTAIWQIDKFERTYRNVLGEREKEVDDALMELGLNIMQYGRGGSLKIYAGVNSAAEILEIKIIAHDNGKGMPYDPNEWRRRSAEKQMTEIKPRWCKNGDSTRSSEIAAALCLITS